MLDNRKRQENIHLRVTLEEKRTVQEKANQYGFPSMTALLLFLISNMDLILTAANHNSTEVLSEQDKK